jgi:hypothetical protein
LDFRLSKRWLWRAQSSGLWYTMQSAHVSFSEKWKSSSSTPEIREYGCGDPLHWPCDTLPLQKLIQTSPTSSGCLDSIVCSWTKATEIVFCFLLSVGFLLGSVFNIINKEVIHPPKCWWIFTELHGITSYIIIHLKQYCTAQV